MIRPTREYPAPHAPEGTARTSGRALCPECFPRDPAFGPARMHPDDLAAHRAQRHRALVRALERDVARLMPHLTAEDRLHLRALADAARDGCVPLDDTHDRVRQSLADHAQRAA